MRRVGMGVVLCLAAAVLVAPVRESAAAERMLSPASLDAFMEGEFAGRLTFRPAGTFDAPQQSMTVAGIPFNVAHDAQGNWRSVDVGPSRWRGMEKDGLWTRASWLHATAETDIVFQLPMGQYCRAYLLAASDVRLGTEPVVALRCGIFQDIGYLSHTHADVPAFDATPTRQVIAAVDGEVIQNGGNRR